MHVFVEGTWGTPGGEKVEYFHFNWGTVDQPTLPISSSSEREEVVRKKQEDWVVDLSKVKMFYFNGLTNDWALGKRETSYPGGLL